MLTKREITEIREILKNSHLPFYLFDDDGDGICSYLILKKFYKNGSGAPVKSSGPLDITGLELLGEEKPDLIIVLDKAVIKQEFIDNAPCQTLYIDHHPIQKLQRIKYYNPLLHKKNSYIPTSYMAYYIAEKKGMWISVIGCLFDYKIPEFIKEFKKEYPGLIKKIKKDPGYLLYENEIGKLVNVFAFNIKGKKQDVKKSISMMEKIESPYEIINQTTECGTFLYQRYEKLNREYKYLLEKAKKCLDKSNVLLFIYEATRTSFTREISTELSYWYNKKTIIIAREKSGYMKTSIRNQKKDITIVLKKALEGLDGYGGGHKHACGANINKKDFDIFVERIKKLTK